jgi:hypothetical protein
MRPEWWRPIDEAWRAFVVIICHTTVGGMIVFSIWGMEHLIHALWPGDHPKLFGYVPLGFVIETAEVGVILAFVIAGTVSAMKALWE